MSKQETAMTTLRLLALATSTAVASSLTEEQKEQRLAAINAAKLTPPPLPKVTRDCIICGDPTGVQCCEFGRDR